MCFRRLTTAASAVRPAGHVAFAVLANIGSSVAIAIMRNRILCDLSTAAALDRSVATGSRAS